MKVLQELSVEEYLKQQGIPFRRSGNEVHLNCPQCEDTKSHLYINVESWLFQCKRCHWSGNRLTWIKERGDLEPRALPKYDQQNLLQLALNFLNRQLPPSLESYLNSRGLSSEQIKKQKFGYGTNLDGLRKALKEASFDPEAVQRSGILQRMKNRWFLQNRIVIPYWKDGQVVWFRGRLDPNRQDDGPKYLSPRNFTIQLYNQDALAPGDGDELFLCEGEPDTWALTTMGFPAVGIPGAGSFKEDWLPLFSRFSKIYLCLDPDQAGQRGAERLSRLLGSRALTVSLPGCDLNDYFFKESHTREQFIKLLPQAQPLAPHQGLDSSELVLPGSDTARLLVPDGWSLTRQGIYQHTVTRSGEIAQVQIAPAPLYIAERTINLDTHEERWNLGHIRDGVWKQHKVDRATALDHRKLVSQAIYGLPVNSLNARATVQFLQAFETINQIQIPRIHSISGFGWKKHNSKQFFVLGQEAIGAADISIVHEAENIGEERMARAVHVQGDLDEWLRAMRLLPAYPRVLLGLYASFVPPLLQLLDLPNFIVDYAGASSQGKTTALTIAASVWGMPTRERGGLVVGWDATKVSIERIASLFNHLPIFLDDSQTVAEQTLQQIVYMIANGVGRLRGATKGMQSTPTWRVVAFSSGERALTDVTEYEGAKARTINIFGSPFGMTNVKAIIHRLQAASRNHYGHAGRAFLEELLPLSECKESLKQLRASYEFMQTMLSEHGKTNIADRLAQYFAAIYIAGKMAERLFAFGGDPQSIVMDAFLEANGEIKESDTSQRALEITASWIGSSSNFFDHNGVLATAERSEAFGVVRTGEYVAVFPHKLKELLERSKFSYPTVLKAWRLREWLHIGSGNHGTCSVWFRGRSERMVKLFWNSLYPGDDRAHELAPGIPNTLKP